MKKNITMFDDISVKVEDMGGIRDRGVKFSPGVNVLAGPNATNRTSLLRAVGGALGGSTGVLRRGADTGAVTLKIDGEEYTRHYQRVGETVQTDGNPYTDQETVVDLFVCLLEDNPIRQAIRAGNDVTDLLLAPIDIDKLEAEIAELQSKREAIDEQLTEIDRERKHLPKLEERRTNLKENLAEIEAELKDLREEAESVGEEDEQSDELASVRTALQETQTELEQTESELETQRSIKDELKTELKDVRKELSQRELRKDELAEIESEIDRLQGREAEISATINELSTVVKQNREVLAGDDTVIAELAATDDTLSKLDPERQSIECWTCGSTVQRQEISQQLGDIEQLVETKRTERKEIREKLSDWRSEHDSLKQRVTRYETLVDRESELEEELERRTESIEELIAEAETLRDELADKQSALEGIKDEDDSVETDIYERISELEYERGRIESDLREVDDKIDEIEYQLGKYDNLESRRESISEQLQELRSRVGSIERETVETFNSHMDSVLTNLGYDNIERVWLERRATGDGTTFDLHIVRRDETGAVFEDSVDHLSESEREVVGLIVALTGYLTHDVAETVPLLLLDSLEAIDADRIAELTKYVSSHTECLLLALLEEDAARLSDSYKKLHAIEQLA